MAKKSKKNKKSGDLPSDGSDEIGAGLSGRGTYVDVDDFDSQSDTITEHRLTIMDAVELLFPPGRDILEWLADDRDFDVIYYFPYEAWPDFEVDGVSLPRDKYGRVSASVSVERRSPYAMPPMSPFDLFAVAAYLAELSGAYHHVVQASSAESRPSMTPERASCVLAITEDDVAECRALAEIWRNELPDEADWVAELRARGKQLEQIAEWWDQLLGQFGNEPVVAALQEKDKLEQEPPAWWLVVIKLLMVADEAAREAGCDLVFKEVVEPRFWFMDYFVSDSYFMEDIFSTKLQRDADQDSPDASEAATPTYTFDRWPNTFSDARRDIACVLPKGRSTPVGCTMRSISHHLALLPGEGVAKARWMPRLRVQPRRTLREDNQFNLLLVPFPFTVTPREFYPVSGHGLFGGDWGFFGVRQSWCHGYGGPYSDKVVDDLADFVTKLVDVAVYRENAERIDAIVFPELALDYKVFRRLYLKLRARLPDLKLIISGLSYNPIGRHGNFVGVATFQPQNRVFDTYREKHHRWRLDEAQIRAYGLHGVLDPRRGWWEDLDLLNRQVDFTVFETNSVLAAMICEDLARVDPCQELLRSIGPNLVIALLMDAPQLRTRWPARYASVLAEDPGSSVLTLTSRGLMTHQRLHELVTSGDDESWVVGLWRDNHYGILRQIDCPPDAQGVWLKLLGAPARDWSLDGRCDTSAVGWIYASDRPLRLPGAKTDYAHLLGHEDLEMQERFTGGRI